MISLIDRRMVLSVWLLLNIQAGMAQSYDPAYIQNLKYRLLVSYIAETREVNTYLQPDKNLDPEGKEKLVLKNSPSVLSGFLFQAENISFYWAAPVPQTQAEKDKFGLSKSNILRFSVLADAWLFNFSSVKTTGFYDDNYAKHPEFPGDTLRYRRHGETSLNWRSMDIQYYPGYKKFCVGVPAFFGERQLKSRFTLGYRMAHNRITLDNGNKRFFRDSIYTDIRNLSASRYSYRGISLGLNPSLYLVVFKRLFIFMDASFGYGIGRSRVNTEEREARSGIFEMPAAKVAAGYQGTRFLLGFYYSYLNQSMKLDHLMIGNILHTPGFIAGFRINQWKYRKLGWETI